jgi:predicted metal-binding transcription factor (methanogenesis marker protein 9)
MLPPIKERWPCQIIKPTSFLETATTLELSTLSASTMTLQKRLAEQLTNFSNVELWEHACKVAKFGSKSD